MKACWLRMAAATLFAVAAPLSPGGAIADEGGPTTRAVAGILRVLHEPGTDQVTSCTSIDGTYAETIGHRSGTLMSTDEAMSGDVTLDTWSLVNLTTGTGTVEVELQVWDADSAAPKFWGHAYGVIEGHATRGVVVGTLADGSRVVAFLTGIHDPPLPGQPRYTTFEIGGPAPAPVDVAVGQQGSCSGIMLGEPVTRDVTAAFRALHDPSLNEGVSCTGPDGNYDEIIERGTGTVLSVDGRLSGDLVYRLWILLNRSTLQGWIEMALEIRDPATGGSKFSGTAHIALQFPGARGVIAGTLADGSRLVANMGAIHDPPIPAPHWVTGEFGGPAAFPIDLALAQRGSCTGVVGL